MKAPNARDGWKSVVRVAHSGERDWPLAFIGRSLGGWVSSGRSLLSIVIGLAIWEGMAFLFPKDVSTPVSVWLVFLQDVSNGVLLTNAAYSVGRVLVGFTAGLGLAVPVAFALRSSRWVRGIVDPWLQFARMIPAIAVIPLVIVFFGIGELSKVSVIFSAVFFVAVITCYQGIRMIDAVQVNAARVLGASGVSLFVKVILPAALPSILTAARLGIATGWTVVVAAELIAASHGLGFMITQAADYFDLPTIYLGIIVIGVFGLVFDRVIVTIEKRAVAWADIAGDDGGTVAWEDVKERVA